MRLLYLVGALVHKPLIKSPLLLRRSSVPRLGGVEAGHSTEHFEQFVPTMKKPRGFGEYVETDIEVDDEAEDEEEEDIVEHLDGYVDRTDPEAMSDANRRYRDKVLTNWADFVRTKEFDFERIELETSREVAALRGTGIVFKTPAGEEEELFQNITWSVHEGQCIGVVGESGAGKSTQLKLLAGELDPTTGSVWVRDGIKIGYVSQGAPTELRENRILSLGDYLDDQFKDAEKPKIARKRVLDSLPKTLKGDDAEDRPLMELSSGQMLRLAVAVALAQEPDLLLLDEPTNHLDLEGVTWLERQIRAMWSGKDEVILDDEMDDGGDWRDINWDTFDEDTADWVEDEDDDSLEKGSPLLERIKAEEREMKEMRKESARLRPSLVVVSHDRAFLDAVSTHTLDCHGGIGTLYTGAYTEFLERKKTRLFALQHRSKEAKAKDAALGLNVMPNKKQKQKGPSRFRIPAAPLGGADEMLKVLGAHVPCPGSGVDGPILLEDVDVTLKRGERLLLLGNNGAGKSTLLRAVAGRLPMSKGIAKFAKGVIPFFFSQEEADGFGGRPYESAVDALVRIAGAEEPGDVYGVMKKLGLKRDIQHRPVCSLSGGERARLCLARMLLSRANLLILDEPTNHLDLSAREYLEESLQYFDGTMILVSHDRYFAAQTTSRLGVIADGRLEFEKGDYRNYLENHRIRPPKGLDMEARPILYTHEPGKVMFEGEILPAKLARRKKIRKYGTKGQKHRLLQQEKEARQAALGIEAPKKKIRFKPKSGKYFKKKTKAPWMKGQEGQR